MSLILLYRNRKTLCFLLYLSYTIKSPFPGFSNLFSFSLYFCSSPSNDHSRFSRSSARFTLAFFHSEISPSRIRRSRRREQALIANDCFRRAQSHLETLTALRFATILWDKCLTRRIIKREVGSIQTAKPYSPTLVSSHEEVIVVPPWYRIGLFPYANDYYDSRSIKHHDASQFPADLASASTDPRCSCLTIRQDLECAWWRGFIYHRVCYNDSSQAFPWLETSYYPATCGRRISAMTSCFLDLLKCSDVYIMQEYSQVIENFLIQK